MTVNDTSTTQMTAQPDLHVVGSGESLEAPTLRSVASRHLKTAKARAQEAFSADDESPVTQARIFVSYSRDEPLASSVWKDLRTRGYDVWVDKSAIPGAADYNEVISRAIREADVFLLLLSPHVARNPEWVWRELKFAQEQKRRVVPVWLRAMKMPEGFDLALAGVQIIDLPAGWEAGMAKLVDTLGDPQRLAPRNARSRFARAKDRVVRVVHQHDLGSAAKWVATGSILTVATVVSAARMRQEQQGEAERQKELARIAAYISRTDELLARAIDEVKFTEGMSVAEYRDDFRPQFNRVLGQLQEVNPPTPELVDHHRVLTERLKRLLERFDALVANSDEPEASSHLRNAARLNAAWSDAITSTRAWFEEAKGQYALLASSHA